MTCLHVIAFNKSSTLNCGYSLLHSGALFNVFFGRVLKEPYDVICLEYAESQEPYCFTPQVGSFEIQQTKDDKHHKVLRQVVLEAPIHWCPIVQTSPVGVIGDYRWSVTVIKHSFSICTEKLNEKRL